MATEKILSPKIDISQSEILPHIIQKSKWFLKLYKIMYNYSQSGGLNAGSTVNRNGNLALTKIIFITKLKPKFGFAKTFLKIFPVYDKTGMYLYG